MGSLYYELSEKTQQDQRLTRRGGGRADLGLLLFNHREALHPLRLAAANRVVSTGALADDLREAVEILRPLFGEL